MDTLSIKRTETFAVTFGDNGRMNAQAVTVGLAAGFKIETIDGSGCTMTKTREDGEAIGADPIPPKPERTARPSEPISIPPPDPEQHGRRGPGKRLPPEVSEEIRRRSAAGELPNAIAAAMKDQGVNRIMVANLQVRMRKAGELPQSSPGGRGRRRTVSTEATAQPPAGLGFAPNRVSGAIATAIRKRHLNGKQTATETKGFNCETCHENRSQIRECATCSRLSCGSCFPSGNQCNECKERS